MRKLTIFTPTYNRKNNLKKLYESLIKQTNNDFCWLVVDDGSTDGTSDLIEKYIKNNKIEITYIFQKNLGKYIAMNTGIKNTKTEYFLCVDSDDYFEKDSISKIISDLEKNKIDTTDNLLGIIYPRNMHCNEKIVLNDTNIDVMDLKFLTNKNIESVIVIKTEHIRDCQFPVIKNEKFMSEEVLYIELSKKGKFKYINDFYVLFGEYLENGMTKNIYKLWKNNANSTLLFLKKRYIYLNKYGVRIKIINKMKTIININSLCIAAHKSIFKNTPSLFWSAILFIPSVIWEKKNYEKN